METKSFYQELPDIELFELLCSEDDDHNYYKEFVERYLPDLTKECGQLCLKRKLDPHIGKQIAHDTFAKVRQYKSFKRDRIKLAYTRKAILVYLIKISTTLFNDHHRAQKKVDIKHRTYFDGILESISQEINIDELISKRDLSTELFKKLNKKEKRVVICDIEYKRHQKYLPDDVNESLSIELGVKKETIRKIRERAIQKLINGINEINQRK